VFRTFAFAAHASLGVSQQVSEVRNFVLVDIDAAELGPQRRVGILSRERTRSKSVISFAYDQLWVAESDSFPIDPSLPLFEGDQYQAALPGIFSDAAPDRWGRTLMERREAIMARRESRRPRPFDDWDFLVGVSDSTRMGALRLARPSDGVFLDSAPLTVPPATLLRDLEHWSRELEDGLPRNSSDEERWIAMLIAPGSSLGGARPKANFLGDDGTLWIAKFPSRDDRHDVGAWEYVVTRLAMAAGIDVPETTLLKLGSVYRTFCSRRFDRSGHRRRLYASAMTMVGKQDGEDASYLDIAQAIGFVADPVKIRDDLKELFRRAVFNVLIGNRDDHLRNHGFLRFESGWRLSPAFDVNPMPGKVEHALALDGTVRIPDLHVVRDTAPFYRLTRAQTDEVIERVRSAVQTWRRVASQIEIPKDEVETMAAAFEEHS
jgi:serine/threonine-protein kinase HipA